MEGGPFCCPYLSNKATEEAINPGKLKLQHLPGRNLCRLQLLSDQGRGRSSRKVKGGRAGGVGEGSWRGHPVIVPRASTLTPGTGQGSTPTHHPQGLSSKHCLFPKCPACAWDGGSGPKWRAKGLNLQHGPKAQPRAGPPAAPSTGPGVQVPPYPPETLAVGRLIPRASSTSRSSFKWALYSPWPLQLDPRQSPPVPAAPESSRSESIPCRPEPPGSTSPSL